jgi:hypothetical protein
MLPLPERLQAIVKVLEESNARIEESREAEETGFLSFKPEKLAQAVMQLTELVPSHSISLDFGCGNGGWALLSAAAGFPTYGIDINEQLIEEARMNYDICVERNLIDPKVVCKFVVGDMIYPEYREAYKKFRKEHNENEQSMPISEEETNPYHELGISPRTADIIYCWSWPAQSRFLYNYLQDTTKNSTIFVLPSYIRYTQGEHMNASLRQPNRLILNHLGRAHSADIFIGKKI